jgi:hypothetical protein
MSGASLVRRWYTKLLRLYPRAFLDEFGEEMLATFSASLVEVTMCSGRNVLVLALREFRGLLTGAVREHARRLKEPTPRPKHLALRGALGFGVGYGLLIVLRYLVDLPVSLSGVTFDAAFLREVGGFTLIGALVAVLVGTSGARRSLVSVVLLTLGLAAAGALATLFLRVTHSLLEGAHPSAAVPRLTQILVQTTAQVVIGGLSGAMLGAARWGRPAILRQALMGCAAFGVPFLVVEGFYTLATVLPVRWPPVGWVIPLSIFAATFGVLAGACLGLSLDRGRRLTEREP